MSFLGGKQGVERGGNGGWEGVEMAGEDRGATIGHPGTVSNGPNA
jgi:hypothetical protein